MYVNRYKITKRKPISKDLTSTAFCLHIIMYNHKEKMTFISFIFLCMFLSPVNSSAIPQGHLDAKVCETEECYEAAKHIEKWMNEEYKPCEDFYEFSCGYWHSPNGSIYGKQHNSSTHQRKKLLNVHLKNFLEDENIHKESKLFQMLKDFMSLCLDEASIKARGSAPAVNVLKDAGGWPVLDSKWSEDSWNFLDTEIRFGGAFIRVSLVLAPTQYWVLFISNFVEKYWSTYNEYYIYINSSDVDNLYKNKCALAEAFGADKTTAENDMKESLAFLLDLYKVIRNEEDSNGLPNTYNLRSLQDTFPWIDWSRLLLSTLPTGVSLSDIGRIFVAEPNKLKNIGDLIEKYPKRTVANYMMWKAALSLTKYLPNRFQVYEIVSGDLQENNKSRYDQCVDMVQRSSLAGVAASYTAMKIEEETKYATTITENLLSELLQIISELEWLDEITRNTAITTLKETKLMVSFPSEALDLRSVEEEYKEVQINSSFFFEAVMDSEKWVKRHGLAMKVLAKNLTLHQELKEALETDPVFKNLVNAIVVSAEFIHQLPLFSSKFPHHINYGQLGFIIAHELTHALNFKLNIEDEGDPLLKGALIQIWGSNETAATYNERRQCIIDQYSAFTDCKNTGKRLNGKRTAKEDIADMVGFKVALQAYQRLASRLQESEASLPNFKKYSFEQMFFISLANTFCIIPDKTELYQQLKDDTHSPVEFRTKGIAMNSPDFSKLFACEEGEDMNPTEKCKVW